MVRLARPVIAALLALGVSAAKAAEITVPGGDIFGFTSGTDVGEPGDKGLAFEFTGRAGKRDGRFFTFTEKTQFSATLAPNLAVAISLFDTYHRIRGVTGLGDFDRNQFDGISGELSWRFMPRENGPFAATVSVEPRYARVDGAGGLRVQSYGAEFKLFVDAVLIPDRLYAAFNLNWAPGTTQADFAGPGYVASSATNISAALTYQVMPTLFIGGEMRFLSSFDGAFLNRNLGNALFVGPTLFYKISDNVAFNAVWTPQVAGREKGNPERRDLANFERHQFRAKLSIGF